MAGVKHTSPEI